MYLQRHNHLSLWDYFQLDLFPTVHQMVWAASTQLVSHCSQIWPDLVQVSSSRTSQASQFSNSMCSPTTDVASTQNSELAHPSYFSNPALMDDNNLQSLHVDTNYKGSQEALKTIAFSASLPPAPLLPHINAHALIHMLHTFYLPLPLHPSHDPPYFCAFINPLSIKTPNYFLLGLCCSGSSLVVLA